jgi:hypothetical protein
MGEKRNEYRIMVGKPDGKTSLRRPRHRWVGNIKMDLREIGLGGMDWLDLARDRDQWRVLVNTVMNLHVQKIGGKFFTIGGFSRWAQLHEASLVGTRS